MRYLIVIIHSMILLLCGLSGFAKAGMQNPAVDTATLSEQSVQLDSLRQQVNYDSLDASFKDSQIILYPAKDYNYAKSKIEALLKQGRHDLLFGMEHYTSDNPLVVTADGKAKEQRPIWVLLVVALLFGILGVLRIIFPVELKIIVDAYYKERLLMQVSKEDSLATSWPYIFLYILFSLSLGMFVVILVSSFSDKNYLTFENFLKNAGFVAILFIAKILLIRMVSFIFLLEKIVREYIAILYLVYFNSMFFLMPFLLAVVLVPVSYFKTIAILYIILVILLFSYRFIRTALHLFGQFKFSIFYLILYLCSLELAPILILVRVLSK